MIWDFIVDHRTLERTIAAARASPKVKVDAVFDGYPVEVHWSSQFDLCYIKWGRHGEYFFRVPQDTDFGTKFYLVCPHTEERCVNLYVRDGRLASLEHQLSFMSLEERRLARADAATRHLVGHEGRGPVRGKRRKAELAKLTALSDTTTLSYDAKVLLSQQAKRSGREAKSQWRLTQRMTHNSTWAALRAGALLDADEGVTPHWKATFDTAAEHVWPEMPELRPIADLTSHAVLDMRSLADWLKLTRGDLKAVPLRFPESVCRGTRVRGVTVDLRDGFKPQVLVQSDQGPNTPVYQQLIPLTRSPPTRPLRWFMTCPITGERCMMLYLRDGFFASRDGQQLRYGSQMHQRRERPDPATATASSARARPRPVTQATFQLSYADLEASGLFALEESSKVLTVQHGTWELQIFWSSVHVSAVVEWREGGRLHSETVGLDQRLGPDGPSRLLICPWTKKAVPLLLMRDNLLACPDYFDRRRPRPDAQQARITTLFNRLKGLDGKAPSRGAHRQRFIKELLDLPAGTLSATMEGELVGWAEELPPGLKQFRSQPGNERLGTREALGWGMSPQAARKLSALLQPILAAAKGPTPANLADNRNVEPLENYPVLDMRALSRYWQLRPGDQNAVRLRFAKTNISSALTVDLAVDVQDPDRAFMLVRLCPEAGLKPSDQVIALSRSAPDLPLRWFLLCPVTGERCDMLFLRDGQFASGVVQRLRYRSQLSKKPKAIDVWADLAAGLAKGSGD